MLVERLDNIPTGTGHTEYRRLLTYQVTYASSKAAVEVVSEGLRRELAPFGVKVATVIVGGVQTNIHKNSPTHHLPPDSFYTPVAAMISDRATGKDIPVRMDEPEVFAKRLVNDLVNGARGRIYRGNISSTMGFLSWLLPSWVMVSVVVCIIWLLASRARS